MKIANFASKEDERIKKNISFQNVRTKLSNFASKEDERTKRNATSTLIGLNQDSSMVLYYKHPIT